ncbi:MAG: HD domain-containing protein [Coriobacteriia bacterium]|nr:HD domain-containing protein [Coriobacteriia bacterium]
MSEQRAVALVTALSGARKAFSLYPPQHPEHRGALEALLRAVLEATADGPFALNLHLGRLYQESRVLPADSPGLKSTASSLEGHRIESLTFHPSFTESDAIVLLEVLARRPSPDLDAATLLEERGVVGVVARRLEEGAAEETAEREEHRVRDRALHRRLAGALRQVTSQVGPSGSPDMGEASVVVEDILNRLMEDNAAVLGLATLHDDGESDLFHAISTMIYALTIGLGLGIPPEGLTSLGLSALLHDIGKMAFDRSDPAERERARVLHPRIGAEILARIPNVDQAAMLVAHEHHMKPGGGGWPEAEPDYVAHPYSRMVAIADRYDRLITDGPNGFGLTPDRAIVQLLRETNDALDRTFTRVFVREMGAFPVGCLVRLSDLSVGVVSAPGEDPLQPRVRLVYGADGLTLEEHRDTDLAGSDLSIMEVVQPADLAETVSDHL